MRARSRRRSLENMYAELNEDHTEIPDSLLLYWSCYLHCLAEAEAYDCEALPDQKSARRRKDAITSDSTWTGRSSGSARETRARDVGGALFECR